MNISTVLVRARRSAAALALKLHPGSKGLNQTYFEIAEFDKHNTNSENCRTWIRTR